MGKHLSTEQINSVESDNLETQLSEVESFKTRMQKRVQGNFSAQEYRNQKRDTFRQNKINQKQEREIRLQQYKMAQTTRTQTQKTQSQMTQLQKFQSQRANQIKIQNEQKRANIWKGETNPAKTVG